MIINWVPKWSHQTKLTWSGLTQKLLITYPTKQKTMRGDIIHCFALWYVAIQSFPLNLSKSPQVVSSSLFSKSKCGDYRIVAPMQSTYIILVECGIRTLLVFCLALQEVCDVLLKPREQSWAHLDVHANFRWLKNGKVLIDWSVYIISTKWSHELWMEDLMACILFQFAKFFL